MGRKSAGIVIEVNREFVNTSKLACMSHYRCGQIIPKNAKFIVCEWTENEEEIVRIIREVFRHNQLTGRDIDAIINNLLDINEAKGKSTAWYERQRIYTLVYVESLLNQGLVEVEWHDWW